MILDDPYDMSPMTAERHDEIVKWYDSLRSCTMKCAYCKSFPKDHVGNASCQNPNNDEVGDGRITVKRRLVIRHDSEICEHFSAREHDSDKPNGKT